MRNRTMLHMKRAMDLFGAAFGLVLLSPVFLAIYIGLKLSTSGSAIFSRAYRIGRQAFQDIQVPHYGGQY